jgi:hypothetical protein
MENDQKITVQNVRARTYTYPKVMTIGCFPGNTCVKDCGYNGPIVMELEKEEK